MKVEDEERIRRIEENQEADALRLNSLQRKMDVILQNSLYGILLETADRTDQLNRRLTELEMAGKVLNL